MEIRQNVPLQEKTTFKVGGHAEYFVTVTSVTELKEAVAYAAENGHEVSILGGGSNLLVRDVGVKGIVIENQITGIEIDDAGSDQSVVSYTVGAGVVFDELVAETVAAGHWGLENLSHIPGSVGATPVQNVGAYGVEVSELISEVQAVDLRDGSLHTFSNADCTFGYRDSFFKSAAGRHFCITSVTYELQTEALPKIAYKDLATRLASVSSPSQQVIRNAVIDIRSAKFPDWRTVGTAGSFFKNPIITQSKYEELVAKHPLLPAYQLDTERVKVPLGFILDKICKLKGVRDGAVGTYEGQALVLVQYGGATAREVDQFAKEIEQTVYEETGISIEREVTKW